MSSVGGEEKRPVGANPYEAEQIKKIEPTVKSMRDYFDSGATKKRSWRLKQLQQLQLLVTKGRERMCQALKKDLGRSCFEGWLLELGLVETELQHAIDHLDEWMRPEKRETNLVNAPGWSEIRREPLGIVYLQGPWNYALQVRPALAGSWRGACHGGAGAV